MPDEGDMRVIEAGYLRWMLRANPFAYLSSESLEEVKEVHVDTDVDERLARLLEDVISGENKRMIFLVGEFGTGKTHRLRLIGEVFENASTFYVKIDVDDYLTAIQRIASVVKGNFPIKVIRRRLPEDPEVLIDLIKEELNSYEVSILLLDEVENVVIFGNRRDAELFSKAVSKIFQGLKGGKAIVIGCIPPAYDVMKRLMEAPHDKIEMRKLSPVEASRILKKRLDYYREMLNREARDLGIEEPFSEDLVIKMNEMAEGNPRKLMKLARNVLAMLIKEFKESGKLSKEKVLQIVKSADEGKEAPPEGDHRGEVVLEGMKPEFAILRQKFPPGTSFSLIEASKVWGIRLTQANALIGELLREGLIYKTESGRYSFRS
ncbi:MAG: hypothetical protein BA066_06520 [Candidatus Korarchaeota archaeon NZ13-K]|nr:MAG: hypothetical protein BA066_06520 [Candidatus Korarchaeota archaeon NZ13-K]